MFYSITKKRNPIKFNYTLHGHSLEHVTWANILANILRMVSLVTDKPFLWLICWQYSDFSWGSRW
jgi:hypothetical protein